MPTEDMHQRELLVCTRMVYCRTQVLKVLSISLSKVFEKLVSSFYKNVSMLGTNQAQDIKLV